MKKVISHLNKVEKIIIAFLALIVVIAGFQIAHAFYLEHTDFTPVDGGVYAEGAVGTIEMLNPLFVHQGSITHDLTQLIFSGLTKYDSETQDIVGDIANFKVSSNGKEYTFVIKEGAKWHDGEPVTADDVMFTYNDVIKNPVFNGTILNYNDYSGIRIDKIDERTVQFLLERPDSFFLVKTMTGLLPRHLLENESIEYLETAPFNFMPTGSGRYKFIAQNHFGDHVEISLEAFEDYYDSPAHIENILIKVFPTFQDLQKKLSDLDGVRNVPAEYTDKVVKKMTLVRYHLPQYVAIFINNESPKLKGSIVRLALQLGTDKEGLIEEIGQNKTIDTPLLEIDQENWVHQYSVKKANGALFDTEWKIPSKDEEEIECEEDDEECEVGTRDLASEEEDDVETQDPASLEEECEENDKECEDINEDIGTSEVTYINSPNEGKDYRTTDTRVTITGTAPANTKSIAVNDYELSKYVPGDPGWSYMATTEYDNLKLGENIFEVYATDFNGETTLIDAITITYGTKTTFFEEEKQQLEIENEVAEELPIRENEEGEKLTLNLITSMKPEAYSQVAEIIKEQWKKIGVDLNIEVLDNGIFQQRVSSREYDLLIFGQNLGYNLDAYPYWHSSQANESGLNLSQFKNFVVDSLLEKARYETEAEDRKNTLNDIQQIISQEVPAVFLYSPTYYFALSDKIQNATFDNLATTSDRFASVGNWYAKVDRTFKEGTGILTFLSWIIKQF